MPGLKPKRRGGIFYAIGSVAGQRVRQSLGTRSEAQAYELCAQHEAKLWKRHSYGEEAVRTFEEAALSYMEAGGEATYLSPLLKRFRGRVLGSIKPGEIHDAARALYPDHKPATRNRQAIVPARAIINHAASKGWCPAIMVSGFAVEKVRRTSVDRSWINAFLAQSDADELPHLSAAVLFMFHTATRVGEVARILPEHVDVHKRVVLLAKTKADEWEVRHITRELAVRIGKLEKTEGGPLFGYAHRWGIYQRMKAVCRRAGIKFVPPHQAGRHSAATNALAKGATVKQVMEAFGWKSARLVLETYAHADGAGRAVADLFDTDRAQLKTKVARNSSGSRRG